VNLAKYRKAQSELDEAEERLAENAAELSSRSRLKNTMAATATRTGPGVCDSRSLSLSLIMRFITMQTERCPGQRDTRVTFCHVVTFYSIPPAQ